jgi:thiol:disulfide interchange protein DsbD
MLIRILLLLAALLPGAALAAEPLEPEAAYRMSARVVDDHTLEATWKIADGYYMYRDKFRFAVEPDSVKLGPAQTPAGKMKHDDIFGQVEIYRDQVKILLPITAGAVPGSTVTLKTTSQGCADMGICYPPLTQRATLTLVSASTPGGAAGLTSLIGGDQPPASTATPAAATTGGDESSQIARLLKHASLATILLFFFGSGVALAFTPCCFPMVPILSGIIVGHGHDITKTRAFVLSLAYVLGMAVTYAIAGVAAGLSGTLLSNALQNAWVLGAFALVFVVLSLSMFGLYELQMPSFLQSKISDEANRQQGGSLHGVVTMGALSAIIVGPCVAAPLAGALLYIAKSGDAVLGGVALFVMALGMGLPLLLVGTSARHLLPKAGPWMEAVKKSFGVILLGVAIWLVSPVLPPVAHMLAWAALLVFTGIFLHALDSLPPQARGGQRFGKGIGVFSLLVGVALLIGVLGGSRDPLQPLGFLKANAADCANPQTAAATTAAVKFDAVPSLAALDARLRTTAKPVLLDFYADWCVSCKEMERFTFADPAVAAKLGKLTLLRADVTANNDDDKALLKHFDLFGPPGIIFFDAKGQEISGSRVVGFQDAAAFNATLDGAAKHAVN